LKRIALVLMAAFAIALAGTASVNAAQGDEHLPCPYGGHFILSPFEGQAPSFDGLTFDKHTGSAVHYTSGPLTVVEFNAIVSQDENLKLSHCLEGSTPSPTPSSTPSGTPEPSPTPTPTSTPTSTPSPTPSVEPTPTPTPSATPTSTPTASPSPTVVPDPSSTPRPSSIPTLPPTDTDEAVSNLANVATVAVGVWIALAVIGALAGIAGFIYIGRRIR
jgi:outer membrane biosynthesis protein TonB